MSFETILNNYMDLDEIRLSDTVLKDYKNIVCLKLILMNQLFLEKQVGIGKLNKLEHQIWKISNESVIVK